MGGKHTLWICAIAWMNKDGSYFPEATYPGIVSGSAFQQAMIEGLEDNGQEVRILSDCDMSSGKRLQWSHNGKSHDVRVAGSGNKFLRIPKKIIELAKELRKRETLDGVSCACAYEMHLPYLFSLRKIKRSRPNIKTVLICPDLSTYMDLDAGKKTLKSFLKKIENRIAKRLLKYVDGYVLFTEQMSEYFAQFQKPYMVVEGVYRDKYRLEKPPKLPVIIHAGSLHRNTGIEQLIDAFEKLDNKGTELWFFGSGAMDAYIREKAQGNPGIKHFGFVDPGTLFEYEKQATLLVNVRDPGEEYTKYSFPSKTFEFMASGTPFLTTRLPGIPAEYEEYLLMIRDNSVEEIRSGLERALSMTEAEREELGARAQKFVLSQKSKTVQAKKLMDFLLSL